MDNNVLLDLWNGKIHPHENLAPQTPEYKDLCDHVNNLRKNIETILTPESKKKFNEYEETSDLISEILHAEAFCVGFRLAAQLLIDVKNDDYDLTAIKELLGLSRK